MKRNFLSILLLLFIISCTHWEASDEINPEITFVGNKIGLIYQLGNLTVNDTLDDLSGDIYNYLKTHQNTAKISLLIVYNENLNTSANFNYYINGVRVETNLDVVSKDVLLMEKESLPNFRCIEGNCGKKEDEKEEIKVKEEPVQKPPVIENKQLTKKKEKRL
jgi:predicted phosphodiesterase